MPTLLLLMWTKKSTTKLNELLEFRYLSLASIHCKQLQTLKTYDLWRFLKRVAASKPTCKLCFIATILITYLNLKTLTTNLGCFPLDKKSYHLLSVCTVNRLFSIRSFLKIGKVVKPPAIKKCSTPKNLLSTLYLHRFRRKPAISVVD
jgi:hypothetical protein